MNKKTARALEEAISHHKRLLKGKTPDELREEGWSASSCSLCSLFLQKGCNGCPVSEKTGDIFCFGSPYEEEAREIERFVGHGRKTHPSLQIEREIEFLESLRDEGE